jgi:hypothetical protein
MGETRELRNSCYYYSRVAGDFSGCRGLSREILENLDIYWILWARFISVKTVPKVAKNKQALSTEPSERSFFQYISQSGYLPRKPAEAT